jgi:HSP20 family protein
MSKRPTKRVPPSRPGEAPAHAAEGFLGGLTNLVAALSALAEKGQQLQQEHGTKTRDGKDVKFHYGISVRTMNGGRDLKVEPFGSTAPSPVNARAGARQASVQEVREPMTDIFEEGQSVLVVAEMPGVAEGDVELALDHDILTIKAVGSGKKYAKEVLLPGPCVSPSIRCASGVVEIRLRRSAEASGESRGGAQS